MDALERPALDPTYATHFVGRLKPRSGGADTNPPTMPHGWASLFFMATLLPQANRFRGAAPTTTLASRAQAVKSQPP